MGSANSIKLMSKQSERRIRCGLGALHSVVFHCWIYQLLLSCKQGQPGIWGRLLTGLCIGSEVVLLACQTGD